jgi:hypothetical protein
MIGLDCEGPIVVTPTGCRYRPSGIATSSPLCSSGIPAQPILLSLTNNTAAAPWLNRDRFGRDPRDFRDDNAVDFPESHS